MSNQKLTPEEERVIVQKGTERPFSGKYHDFQEKGTYVCKRCGAALYERMPNLIPAAAGRVSTMKFAGAVKRQTDADGMRTEIMCASCSAHLGHVFLGEGFTAKNTRHCVNSISMNFIPRIRPKHATAVFASGCFWGTQYLPAAGQGRFVHHGRFHGRPHRQSRL